MLSKILVGTVLVLCCFVACYGYSDCGSEVGEIVSLEVSGCDNVKRCILKRNTNVSMTITFKSNVDSDSVTAVVHGVMLGKEYPFAQLPNADGCKDSGLTCPIKSGQSYNYSNHLPISGSYPRVTVDVKWQLQDQNGKAIVCSLIPSKVA